MIHRLTRFDTNTNPISIHIDSFFLLQIHPYSIVWYILQVALFLFWQIISYVVKTNFWYRHIVETLRPKLNISKFVHFAEICQKIIIITSKLNFFKFRSFFRYFLVVSYLLTEKKSLNYSFTKPYPCNIDSFETTGLWPRLAIF